MQKYLPTLLLIATLLSLVVYPTITPALGTITLLLSLALSTYVIYDKHKGTEPARAKILKEVGVMVFTFILVLFLGGVTALLANAQVGIRWGEIAGIVSALGASFLVGYLVCKGMMRLRFH